MDVVRRRIVQAVLVARGISATDFNCLLGAAETGEPDVLTRGGDLTSSPDPLPVTSFPSNHRSRSTS